MLLTTHHQVVAGWLKSKEAVKRFQATVKESRVAAFRTAGGAHLGARTALCTTPYNPTPTPEPDPNPKPKPNANPSPTTPIPTPTLSPLPYNPDRTQN